MSEVTSYSKRGAVGVICLDNPPVNGFGYLVRAGVFRYLEAALADDDVAAIVIHGAGRMFSAGADIREFGTDLAVRSPNLREIIDAAERATKPVVAAIHGVAAGGGCEFALGCHYRIAAADARIGLPEVNLGIIPGAGGTQRLPRLTGVSAALEFIVQGKLNPAAKAHDLGLLDELFEGDPADAGAAYAHRLIEDGRGPRRTCDRNERIEEAMHGRRELFRRYREETARRARGVEAPIAAIESVENVTRLAFDEGLKEERRMFDRLVVSDQSKAMRHAFFADRQVAKIPDVPKETPTRPVEKVGVVGCGTMGQGISMAFANAGIPVKVLDRDQATLDAGLEKIESTYASSVSKGRLTPEGSRTVLSTIAGTLELGDLADVDLVVEAVFEDLELKCQVFARLDDVCKPGTILATNTSTLDLDRIAAATSRPGDVVGLHFFSPAHVMRLLEIVRGASTQIDVIATATRLAKRLGKTGVVVGVCDGFAGNRMLAAYLREAYALLEEGALPQQIDKVLYDFGFAMGPFAMLDLAGLDVGYRIRKHRAKTAPEEAQFARIEDRLVESGRRGQKSGAGWYRYEPGTRDPVPDADVEELILETSGARGIERRALDEDEILERCLYPLVNEGAKLIEEGIVIRSSDIDLLWLYGYGFPRYRGGPMFWADLVGVRTVHDALVDFQESHGARMKPAELLRRLAEEGGSFSDT